MKLRGVRPDDLPAVGKLFAKHGLPENTIDFASTTGHLVYEPGDGTIVGAAFLYLTNSPIAMIDLFVVDPGVKRQERAKLIDGLLEVLKATAIIHGYKHILAEPRFAKSFERLEKHGFKELKPGSFILEL